jgi:hypothetical protein
MWIKRRKKNVCKKIICNKVEWHVVAKVNFNTFLYLKEIEWNEVITLPDKQWTKKKCEDEEKREKKLKHFPLKKGNPTLTRRYFLAKCFYKYRV